MKAHAVPWRSCSHGGDKNGGNAQMQAIQMETETRSEKPRSSSTLVQHLLMQSVFHPETRDDDVGWVMALTCMALT
eukprot:3663857-Rhodomonas_salina.1